MRLRGRDPGKQRRLRVGVPESLSTWPPLSGHGRVWTHVLDGLAAHVDLEYVPDDDIPTRRRKRSVDVWLANGHNGALGVSRPWVAHVHEADWFSDEMRDLLEPSFLEHIDAATGTGVRSATRVLTQSQSSRDQIAGGYGIDPDRVDVAYPGVDTDVFRPEHAPRASGLVAGAGGRADRPYVLYVGTFHPRKNIAALRRALADLVAGGANVQLVVVGGPPLDRADSTDLEREALSDLPGRAGRVVSAPALSDTDLATLMAGAVALCLPSFSEGFGLPVLEAMACGCPVVAADRAALPEVVGDAGMLVEPDAASVRYALGRLLTEPDLHQRLSSDGIARARGFTWEATVDLWHRSLQRAVAKNRP